MDEFRRRPVNRLNPDAKQPTQQTPTQSPQPLGQLGARNSNATPLPAQQVTTPQLSEPAIEQRTATLTPQPINETRGNPQKPKKNKKKRIIWIISAAIGLIIVALAGIFIWYTTQLAPVESQNTNKTLIRIDAGTTPNGIADVLKEEGLIRSQTAFLWYTRLEGVQNQLQAGTYRLSPSESTQQIVAHLKGGNVDTFDITFLPGETLADSRKTLLNSGYSPQEVDTALAATYASPLFEGKPASADLEGYIYGDTYRFGAGTDVKTILEHVFESFYEVVQKNDLVNKYQANGLSLYEGITLASIVQRESIGGDEPQIAQVFYKRLSIGMMLGSDVTYQYIADKMGVPRDVNLDSPYNTRRYAGLPPGPIATPGVKALLAVATPAQGDYLYFLSGDDDITYFAATLEEHEANILAHCKIKCQII